MDQYALIFTSFNDIARHQDAVIIDFAEATAGRIGGPIDPASTQLQLTAAERMRTQLALISEIAGTTIKFGEGKLVAGWKPIERHRWQRLKDQRVSQRQQCLATVKAVAAPVALTG